MQTHLSQTNCMRRISEHWSLAKRSDSIWSIKTKISWRTSIRLNCLVMEIEIEI